MHVWPHVVLGTAGGTNTASIHGFSSSGQIGSASGQIGSANRCPSRTQVYDTKSGNVDRPVTTKKKLAHCEASE